MRYNSAMNKTPRQNNGDKRSREKKDVPLNIRVAQAEKAAFDMAAEIAGIPLSAWMRERLRSACRKELIEAGLQVPFIQTGTKE